MAYSKKTKEKIEALEKKIAKLDVQIVKKNREIKKLESEYQDLNVKYKYTLFDIEATRREIAHYKKMLEDRE